MSSVWVGLDLRMDIIKHVLIKNWMTFLKSQHDWVGSNHNGLKNVQFDNE